MSGKLVRLKPYNKQNRCVLQTYTYQGQRYEANGKWYRVGDAVATYLEKVRQVDTDPTSPFAFDVCTEEEARTVINMEKRRAEVAAATIDEPVVVGETPADLTTDDLRGKQAKAPPAPTKKGGKPASKDDKKAEVDPLESPDDDEEDGDEG